MKGKYIQLAAGIIVTVLFLVLAYQNLGHLSVSRIFHYPVQYPYVVLAVVAFMVSQWFRALAWSRGMAPDIPQKTAFPSVCMGNGSNMLLPFRIGEVVRVVTVSQTKKSYYAVAGINLIVERLLDVCILILLAVFVAFFIQFDPAVQVKLALVRNVMLAGMVIGCAALALLIHYRKTASASPRVPRILKKGFAFLERLSLLRSPLVLVRTLFYLGCSWGCVYLSTVFGLMSVGLFGVKYWVASLVVIVLTNMIMLIPAAPGGIGVFQYAATYALSLFHVVPLHMALLAVLLHLIQYAALLPLSIYYFIKGEFRLSYFLKKALNQDART
ncbi:lysylphosphatidylglycerol synthase transmembrane domain-containing protein [Aneurinibacillus sp. Ricciae_BoGa-3]|uniref:lysylphosphatidylglycerol synthase transmembrane domain-containing protein n=1 Tax=Aneurinibacillus sp. Ricciae_BoGa-3 TaxID=3022697 RepID=UPI00234265BA|nr:lysylphosphatidylglycerol synthase transmembrane domain-containing protein [Aneurinibacillus sp. Ricciae_BoGa-3]WCK54974.1 lysylphosphatidylglycerol synthase transmembrane domain-containing protein [Aneurinibacillus sp. Ricciae_BoGa-3]